MKQRQTYATTQRRVYLETTETRGGLQVRTASDDGIAAVTLVRTGAEQAVASSSGDARVVETSFALDDFAPDEYAYVRVTTHTGDMAWSSPWWGDERAEP